MNNTVPGETSLPVAHSESKMVLLPLIFLAANYTNRDVTDDAAVLFNTEEFSRCNGKKFNAEKYVQSGVEGYGKCFLYLHSGHKPCFMQCLAYHYNVLSAKGRVNRKVVRKITFDITPKPYKRAILRIVLFCFSLVQPPFPEIDGRCDAAHLVVGCFRNEFRKICHKDYKTPPKTG